jgi:hypothetical protein
MDLAAVALHLAVALQGPCRCRPGPRSCFFIGGSELVSHEEYVQNLGQAA